MTARQWIEQHGGMWNLSDAMDAFVEGCRDHEDARRFRVLQGFAKRSLRYFSSPDGKEGKPV